MHGISHNQASRTIVEAVLKVEHCHLNHIFRRTSITLAKKGSKSVGHCIILRQRVPAFPDRQMSALNSSCLFSCPDTCGNMIQVQCLIPLQQALKLDAKLRSWLVFSEMETHANIGLEVA
jgi:hypothetical protein